MSLVRHRGQELLCRVKPRHFDTVALLAALKSPLWHGTCPRRCIIYDAAGRDAPRPVVSLTMQRGGMPLLVASSLYDVRRRARPSHSILHSQQRGTSLLLSVYITTRRACTHLIVCLRSSEEDIPPRGHWHRKKRPRVDFFFKATFRWTN